MILSDRNKFLILLLSVLFGTFLLLLNSKTNFGFPGIIPIFTFFISIPILLIFFSNTCRNISKVKMLLLLFIPLVIINYIYYLKIGFPVGFEDVHDHIHLYNHLFDSGKIQFSNAGLISYNFVSFYILNYIIENICQINIVMLASIIPPFINLSIILFVYLIGSRLFSNKIGLLAALLFGWTDSVLLFGHEFRTQTLGTLYLFAIFSVFSIFFYKNQSKSMEKIFLLILLILVIVTTSFVSIFVSLLIFISVLFTSIFYKKKNAIINHNLILLFIIFLIVYLIYIGTYFENILLSVYYLINKTFYTTTISTPQVGQILYGDFVKYFTYSFWLIFIIGSIYYFKQILNKKMDLMKTVFFISFSLLFSFGILTSFIGVLSSGRVYAISMILIGIVITYFFLNIIKKTKLKNKKYIKILLSTIVILYICTSLVKFPNYIIGETLPIRDKTDIDNYNYWCLDDIDYTISAFMYSNVNNHTIHYHMLIKNYMIRESYDNNKKNIFYNFNNLTSLNSKMIFSRELIILENSEKGKKYIGRELIPNIKEYEKFNTLYDNRDYILYLT